MKSIKSLALTALFAGAIFTACDDKEPGTAVVLSKVSLATEVVDALVMDTDADSSDVELAFTVELDKASAAPVTVRLAGATQALPAGTSLVDSEWYVVVGDEVVANKEVTVPAGETSAAATIRIAGFAAAVGVTYALPVEILSVTSLNAEKAGDAIVATVKAKTVNVWIQQYSVPYSTRAMDASGNVQVYLSGKISAAPAADVKITVGWDSEYTAPAGYEVVPQGSYVWGSNPYTFLAGAAPKTPTMNVKITGLDTTKDYVMPFKITTIEGMAVDTTETTIVVTITKPAATII